MTMYGNFISLIFLTVLISIHGQHHDDERDLPPAPQQAGRSSKFIFESQFDRGRCPERFYQSGDECLYFSTDGKIYSWYDAERVCSRRVARMLHKHSSSDMNQPNMMPTKGVRALVLNTPKKTEILQAFYQEYNEQNYAVHLPSDYNTLRRCPNSKDDKWPEYCTSQQNSNSSCFETVSRGPNDICLREVDCRQRYLRVACEFTLPGSSELTNSQFRTCPKAGGFRRRLPLWGWILIGIGSALLLLAIILAILGFLRKKKSGSSSVQKRSLPEPRQADEKTIRVTTAQEDPAYEPMLIKTAPAQTTDTGYLQPRSLPIDNTSNA